MALAAQFAGSAQPGPVVTKAVLRAAAALDMPARALAGVLGVSEATLSRMKRGDHALERTSKSFELAVLFIRMFRSLDAIAGGDESVARQWLVNHNTALDGVPAQKIATITGLLDVIAYLDARRARV